MGITVSDIEQKEFAFKGAGYDPYDVDSYLDQICDEMIAMQDRIDALEAELKQTKAALANEQDSVKPIPQAVVRTEATAAAPVQKTSETLETILLSAQRISDEAIETAKRKAETIIAEAQDKASTVVDDAQEEKLTLEKELKSLRSAAVDYKKRFLSLLNEQKSLLDAEKIVFEDGDEPEELGESVMEPAKKSVKK